jgi:hypothetical protein
MSTALAIAATTRVLASVIDDNVSAASLTGLLGTAQTTASPPDKVKTDATEGPQLNLFLYQVSFNPGWREVGLPSRDGAGNGIDRPPLGLDLHYMLTAYGPDDYTPEILLGLGVQALHETPFLYRQKIRDVFTPPPPLSVIDQTLATANLAEQIEMIKIAPSGMNLEELSKLWTALQGKYRPSAAFHVSVVLIESTARIRSPLPVLRRNLAVLPFQEPNIDAITPQILAWSPNASVAITGQNLRGPGVVVIFAGNPDAPAIPTLTSGGRGATVVLPALPAGINTLRVVRQLAIGTPPPRNIVESNVGSFILRPVIRGAPNEQITVGGATVGGVTPMTVTLDPAMEKTQTISLLLNQLNPPVGVPPLSYSFDAASSDIAANAVTFGVSGVDHSDYLVRVRIDGAESPLRADPSTGQFIGPKVSL